MPRILVLTNLYPPHHYGGYELSCRDVVERWRRRGHTVDVLTSDLRVAGATDADDGVVRSLRASWADHRFRRRPLPLLVRDERHNLAVLRDVLRTHRPDVVSVWNLAGLPLALLREVVTEGLPTVLVVCNEWPDFWPAIEPWSRQCRRRPRLARAVARMAALSCEPVDLGGAGAACFVSDALRRRAPVAARESAVVHSGIDTSDFPIPDDVPAERPWSWRLLYVGRIDRDKGIETAIHALAFLPAAASLTVVGQGHDHDRRALERLAASVRVADRVRFTACDRGALAAVYAHADVVVFPSVWEEPFGLVPLEAMACATPVVATFTGGSAEYLLDGANALRFAVGDTRGLAAAVTRLADEPSLRDRLRHNGIATARRFTVDRLAGELERRHVRAASLPE